MYRTVRPSRAVFTDMQTIFLFFFISLYILPCLHIFPTIYLHKFHTFLFFCMVLNLIIVSKVCTISEWKINTWKHINTGVITDAHTTTVGWRREWSDCRKIVEWWLLLTKVVTTTFPLMTPLLLTMIVSLPFNLSLSIYIHAYICAHIYIDVWYIAYIFDIACVFSRVCHYILYIYSWLVAYRIHM